MGVGTHILAHILVVHVHSSHGMHLDHTLVESITEQTSSLATFRCKVCLFAELGNDEEYFSHINLHLKSHETISCKFKDCTFMSNIYGTFKSHKNRKHLILSDFKPGIVTVRDSPEISSLPHEHEDGAEFEEVLSTFQTEERDVKALEERLAAVLLKLENVLHVPSSGVDELL